MVKGFDLNPQGNMTINCLCCDNSKHDKCPSETLQKGKMISSETALKFCACYRELHDKE